MKSKWGFTLLEVLVALMILGIALTAVFRGLIEDSRISNHLKNKSFAHWVGLTLISNFQLTYKIDQPLNREETGNVIQFAKKWYWTINPTANNNPYYSEFILAVKENKNSTPLSSLRFFVSKTYENENASY